jgi:hypothetical protein
MLTESLWMKLAKKMFTFHCGHSIPLQICCNTGDID